MTSAVILVVAYLFDVLLGDPPNRLHPVAWMGHWISYGKRMAAGGNLARFVFGMIFVVLSSVGIGAFAWVIQETTAWLPLYLSLPLHAWILNCCFSTRSLARAAHAVRGPLERGDLEMARSQLSYHLVSRDTSQLNDSQVAAAVIESVSENTSDSVVAPIFFFCIAGLPGAVVYRFVNTCDAMLGYRTVELEWLGKFPARLDDVLNWIPARMTAGIMVLVSGFTGGNWRQGLRIWKRDRNNTESPNAGHPMSMAAGLLGVELEKVGNYCLGRGLAKPGEVSILGAIQLLWRTSGTVVLLSALLIVALAMFR